METHTRLLIARPGAVELLDRNPALLVLAGGRPLSILSRTDVLSYLEAATHG